MYKAQSESIRATKQHVRQNRITDPEQNSVTGIFS